MNNWMKILLGFKKQYFPKYDYGLTPRFIVGVCQIPIGNKFKTPELAKEATKQMFNEMKEFNKDNYIVMSSFCGNHTGTVLNLSNQIWSENSIGITFEEIWKRYGTEIIDGNYQISPEEKDIVERIFEEL